MRSLGKISAYCATIWEEVQSGFEPNAQVRLQVSDQETCIATGRASTKAKLATMMPATVLDLATWSALLALGFVDW